ncbi:MAG TPA: SDR family NAD(P)-dependent oxidoreductase [Stellaceae bacterium]|nr:SDR family NAD(P)-dependent oxidoreductase [Stellaceae bacterium]
MPDTPRSLLITGASSGIGEALARRYAAPGVALALSGRDEARLAAVAEACRAKGAAVDFRALDVTDRAGLRAWIERVDDGHPLDLAIANAGISAGTGGTREDEGAARRVFAVNLEGVLNTAYPVLARFLARGRGQIGLMSSLAGYRGLPTAPAYSASKAAVKALGEAWRVQLAPDGVRVSVICPGFVVTRMTARNHFAMPFLMPAERAAGIIARGLARNEGRIAFPWPTAAASWLLGALPASLSDALTRRFARSG